MTFGTVQGGDPGKQTLRPRTLCQISACVAGSDVRCEDAPSKPDRTGRDQAGLCPSRPAPNTWHNMIIPTSEPMQRVGPSPGLNTPRTSNAITPVLLVRFANQLPTTHSRSVRAPCANELPATHFGMQRCSVGMPPLTQKVGKAQAGMCPMNPPKHHITKENTSVHNLGDSHVRMTTGNKEATTANTH